MSHNHRVFVLLTRVTVFLAAFLLFLIEPMIAKMILPWFGGSAAVWATCLVFFQSALLLGYWYADVSSRRLTPRQQVAVHVILLLLCLLFLPMQPPNGWRPQASDDPVLRILELLFSTIGLPFVVLSATSPLAQTWFARALPDTDPYRLFSISNLGSFLALLSYPFLIEPQTATGRQAGGWSVLFILFAVLCSGLAYLSRTTVRRERDANEPDRRSSPLQKLRWVSLSACGAMILLTITAHLTQNVSPVPLLWVLPLALYLLSFTLVFGRRPIYRRLVFGPLLALALAMIGYPIYNAHGFGSVQISVPLFCLGLFIICLFCHGELHRTRPAEDQLTPFYLMMSLGGALGSVLVGIVAPKVFAGPYEYPAALLLTAILALLSFWEFGWLVRSVWVAEAAALVFVLYLHVTGLHHQSIALSRNFYGMLRVTESAEAGKGPLRSLYNGTIRHGAQFRFAPWSRIPITYYGYQSGIGLALQHCCQSSKRVGIIGLGSGTLAAYGRPGDVFHFYDIDPNVIAIAHRYFTYLRDSPASLEYTQGDARLALEREGPQNFDVLAVDAFSGDAIPVHLLTEQAMSVYFRHLKPQGILAIHTSNTYLALDGLVQHLADHFGYRAKLIESDDVDGMGITSSEWVLASADASFLNSSVIRKVEQPFTAYAGRLWTDDYNNLFQILRPLHSGS